MPHYLYINLSLLYQHAYIYLYGLYKPIYLIYTYTAYACLSTYMRSATYFMTHFVCEHFMCIYGSLITDMRVTELIQAKGITIYEK
jgi:hypothetical protein